MRPLISVLFIDPYKQEARPVSLRNDIFIWHKALQCDCCGVSAVAENSRTRQQVDLWYDDEFLLHDVLPPAFRFKNPKGEYLEFRGYAFLAEANGNGDTVSLNSKAIQNHKVFKFLIGLEWEDLEKRKVVPEYINQQLRTPELEMDGDFKYLSD